MIGVRASRVPAGSARRAHLFRFAAASLLVAACSGRSPGGDSSGSAAARADDAGREAVDAGPAEADAGPASEDAGNIGKPGFPRRHVEPTPAERQCRARSDCRLVVQSCCELAHFVQDGGELWATNAGSEGAVRRRRDLACADEAGNIGCPLSAGGGIVWQLSADCVAGVCEVTDLRRLPEVVGCASDADCALVPEACALECGLHPSLVSVSDPDAYHAAVCGGEKAPVEICAGDPEYFRSTVRAVCIDGVCTFARALLEP